jgi:2-polyprenyl-3-methyl-5-hydroxy-6-metoxy-1,4-benzoquinol methylase
MKKQQTVDRVSSWYTTAGFYKQLVQFGFRTIQPFLNGKTVLEIGPADGAMTTLLSDHFPDISLVEPSGKYAIMLHKKFPEAVIHQSLVENFHPPGTYDTIIMAHVLEHITDPVLALKHLKKAMQKSSRLIIIVPNADSIHRHVGVAMHLLRNIHDLNAYDKKLGHQRVYDRAQLHSHIKRAGLSIVSEGGIMIKPLSNAQMESWKPKMIQALYTIGKSMPKECGELYCICKIP